MLIFIVICQELRRDTHELRATIVVGTRRAESDVCVLRLSLQIEVNVLGFEVAIADVQAVRVFDRQEDIGSVGPATALRESTL